MRRRIKIIYDLLERIHVAGPEVDIMAAVRQELVKLDRQVVFASKTKLQEHADPSGDPGDPSAPGVPVEDGKVDADA